MSNILVLLADRIFSEDGNALGPGLRSLEMAKSLARCGHQVTIAEPGLNPNQNKPHFPLPSLQIIDWNRRNLNSIVKENDVVLSYPTHRTYLYLKKFKNKTLIVDLFDPTLIESLSGLRGRRGMLSFARTIHIVRSFLLAGDFFICAGERQRLYYIGMLSALGRINPFTCNDKLIAVVPTCVCSDKPKKSDNLLLKGKIIPDKQNIILWPSGIYRWYDAITAINAMKLVSERRSDISMVFQGAINPVVPESSQKGYNEAEKKAEELQLLNKFVFFAHWLPYETRASMYFEAEFAVITFYKNLETELSFRARTLDCLWGGLPVLCTEGDEIGSYIKKYGAGDTVEAGNEKELAEKIIDLLCDGEKLKSMSSNINKLVEERLNWTVAIGPLHEFCTHPNSAKDNKDMFVKGVVTHIINPPITSQSKLLALQAFEVIKKDGLGALIKKMSEL